MGEYSDKPLGDMVGNHCKRSLDCHQSKSAQFCRETAWLPCACSVGTKLLGTMERVPRGQIRKSERRQMSQPCHGAEGKSSEAVCDVKHLPHPAPQNLQSTLPLSPMHREASFIPQIHPSAKSCLVQRNSCLVEITHIVKRTVLQWEEGGSWCLTDLR